ncbi:glycosyltransferase [Candidatus Kaiserbacteria bacterium]|nr:glycosyltransferase [Candidatus Kaiserbacteria bacterium]
MEYAWKNQLVGNDMILSRKKMSLAQGQALPAGPVRRAALHRSESASGPGWFAFMGVMMVLIYIVLVIKVITLDSLEDSALFASYSILVSAYILSRFLLAYFYVPKQTVVVDTEYRPFVSFVTPAKNEGEHIAETLRAMLGSDYPGDKFEIIAINDGSTDDTGAEMHNVQREAEAVNVKMTVIDWERNRGKRDGMAEGVRAATGDIIVFVDSDSFVADSTVKELVKYFKDPAVAAAAGHAEVHNAQTNLLTKMQAVRYFVAFKAYKSAEALFGAVTCCSGCCSAYRKSAIDEILDDWQTQRFLGARCTYGDDRALTNCLLKKGWKTVYAPEAFSTTIVPDTWRKFLTQQLRWKKSWTRESFKAAAFLWKRHPIAAISFYLGILLPLLAPIVAGRALLWLPAVDGIVPWIYIGGLILMSMIYGVYYRLFRKDSLWIYGMFFSWFYTLVLVWQLPYAIVMLRDTRWGTR